MALKKTAREYLIETVKELLQHKTIDEITVADILAMSGVSRTTFYKHFPDKQALAEQVFIDELSRAFFYDCGRTLFDCEVDILRRIEEHRKFYEHAIKSDEFLRMWAQQAMDSNMHRMRVHFAGRDVPDTTLRMCAYLMSQTFAGATIDWVRHRPPDMTIEQYARYLVEYFVNGLAGIERHFVADLPGPMLS